MTDIFVFTHNTAYGRGLPEIVKIVDGLHDPGPCERCGVSRAFPHGELAVELGDTIGQSWPDVMACGDYPCLVISDRFVQAMADCQIELRLGGGIEFVIGQRPGQSATRPRYFWVDGHRHRAGRVDFDASGFVDVRFCPSCGNRTDDVAATYDRQHRDPAPPLVILDHRQQDPDLFTTDLSPTAFFATERVLACAKKHKLTNAAFLPCAAGILAKPAKY